MKTALVFLVLVAMASFAEAEKALKIDESTIFELSDSLKLLTPTPHLVSAALAELCVAPTPSELLSAEKDRAGPHANIAVNFYVSPDGEAAMSSTELKFPTGTIVLKEKLSPSDGQVAAVGGMIKRAEGFDPKNGNWEYFYAAKSGGFKIGRIPSCVGCHARVSSSDYVYSRAKGSR